MTRVRTMLVMMLAALTLLGCSQQMTEITPTAAPTLAPDAYSELTMRWLTGVPCRAPCWEGVVLGETSTVEALDLLRDKPFLLRQGVLVTERYHLRGNPVVVVQIDLPEAVALKDIIAAYGEPSHITAFKLNLIHDQGTRYYAKLGWERYSMVIMVSSFTAPEIDADLGITSLELYAPEIYRLEDPAFVAAVLPWQGYGTFSQYCSGRTC